MPGTFLGTGWGFPVQVDAGGGIRTRSGEEDIKEAIGIILGTRLGERYGEWEVSSGSKAPRARKTGVGTCSRTRYSPVVEDVALWIE